MALADYSKTQYRIAFLHVATYEKCGDTCLLSVFGVTVYERIGDYACLLGLRYRIKSVSE